ncbi:MAG TPA: carbohydrate ABC transporter permease [Thermomicrobiales bacterium]|nr:carbohydrate ABC transporter permease [Thermomicrobiales bacterium]
MTRRQIGPAIAYIVLILGCVIAIAPFIVTILASLKTSGELVRGIFSLPEDAQWKNYVQAWRDGHFGRFFLNSIIVVVGVVIPSVVMSTMTGYAFARFRFRGAGALFAYFLLGLVIPLQALVVPLYYLLREMHLLDSLWALILPQIAMSMSFGTLLMRQAFLSVPREIMEAATVDGASSWTTLWQVMFPLARPMVGTTALMFFIWTWNEFLLPLVVNIDPKYHTLPVGLLYFQQRWTSNIPVIAAGATIIFLPLVAMFLLFQRQLVEGITQGAVKG